MTVHPIQAGPYTGEMFGPKPPDAQLLAQLATLGSELAEATAVSTGVRNAITRLSLTVNGVLESFAVKSFPKESWLRDKYFLKSGSKARRSFFTSVRLHNCGVGTPRPFAYIERWDHDRLCESYYLCEFQDNISCFRDELNRLYRDDPLCRRIMTLMQTVAYAVADMHDAGVFHRDLGNQNIMLRRVDDDTWGDVQFIDLNRAQLVDNVSEQQRARDVSRIDLPSDFLRVFKCMYHRDQHPSEEFNRYEDRYRRRFAFHTASRKYRHPIRATRERKRAEQNEGVPRGSDLWVWDDRSVQAVSTMRSRERHQYYPARNHIYVAKATLKSLIPVHGRYRELLKQSFAQEVDLSNRIGIAVGTAPGQEKREARYLSTLGKPPVLLRFYRHESDAYNRCTFEEAARLKQEGHGVFVSLIQDRAAVREPGVWKSFVDTWVPALSGVADWVEVGHAVNRVKWGVWDIRDYKRMLAPVMDMAFASDGLKVCGPAIIDFEYHYLAALLDLQKGEEQMDALSAHLYVDRRGAPENKQGAFSVVEKCALAKAYAGWSPAVKGDQFIVSEVNWPLLETGHYSPVCSPYVIPFSHTNDPSVDEETYADYMIRYYTLALCSGHVDAVYWWRLAARGFGLIDDLEEPWRLRPAYHAMTNFQHVLGTATFKEKLQASDGVYAFRFSSRNHGSVVLCWAHPNTVRFVPPFAYGSVLDRDGNEVSYDADSGCLTHKPVYFIGVH